MVIEKRVYTPVRVKMFKTAAGRKSGDICWDNRAWFPTASAPFITGTS